MQEQVWEMALKAYALTLLYYEVALMVIVLGFLPLAIWHKTRNAAGVGLLVTSYILGAATWLFCAAVTFGAFGWIGLLIGLLSLGVGVVPFAIIGAIYILDNSGLALGLFILVVVTFTIRYSATYAWTKTLSLKFG